MIKRYRVTYEIEGALTLDSSGNPVLIEGQGWSHPLWPGATIEEIIDEPPVGSVASYRETPTGAELFAQRESDEWYVEHTGDQISWDELRTMSGFEILREGPKRAQL